MLCVVSYYIKALLKVLIIELFFMSYIVTHRNSPREMWLKGMVINEVIVSAQMHIKIGKISISLPSMKLSWGEEGSYNKRLIYNA